ncbi:S24/S26 family peptidase, partial [Desulforamulus ruminis]|uniref:S24/S26 family peptidase n=1 Tax=Desulforamulus ruminis TaxID=1564 RepID=UPI002354EED2
MDHLYQVSGCSMMPTLADGDVIEIVDRRWQDGDIVVARVGSKTVVKRVVGDKLVGDNNISTKFNIFDVVILGKIKKIHCLPSSYLLQSAEATYEKLRVIGLDSNNVWKVYDVDINTGAKTLVSGFTDFSAFNSNRPTVGSERDSYVYFTSTMSYIGNGKLRVITNDNNNTWKAYDVDVNTGAKTLVSGFTDFSAF